MNLRALFLSAMLLAAPAALAGDLQPSKNAGPYVPSPEVAVAAMLEFARLGPDDFIIDLGSGDGRIVRTAAKVFGVRGFGVEIKEELVLQSNEAARKEGLSDRIKFVKQDLFKTDISQATVLTMYLLPDTVNMLKEKLLSELRPGTRVVSHDYPLTGWVPDDMKEFNLPEKVAISGVQRTYIWLYVVPAKIAGRWDASLPSGISHQASFTFRQHVNRVTGMARMDGREALLEEVTLRGDQITFKVLGRKEVFSGRVNGKVIEGQVDSAGRKAAWMATLGG